LDKEEQKFLKDNLSAIEEKEHTVFNAAMRELYETIKDRLSFYEGNDKLQKKLTEEYKELKAKPETEDNRRRIRRLESFIRDMFPSEKR
jgi:TRAP-type C4-dicarboxylate transport system substrate-binding protein